MALIRLEGVGKHFGGETLFEDVSCIIQGDSRIGVVGQNGEGKTTLLRIISGDLAIEEGRVTRYGDPDVAMLEQDPVFDGEASLMEAVMESFGELLDMQRRLRRMEDAMPGAPDDAERERILRRYGSLMTTFEDRGGYDMEARARETLLGLGFCTADLDRKVHTFSGGEKVRLALARLLLGEPDVLLLDEPTNHLDLGATEWLEEYLVGYRGALLLVSHDRYFLDRVTSETLEVHRGRIESYPTNYSGYLEAREERRRRRMQQYERQREEIERLEAFVRRYKAGQRSREARSRQGRLDRMQRLEPPPDYDGGMRLEFPLSRASGRDVLAVEDLQIRKGGLRVCSGVNLRVYRGDRIGLLGPNGSGKTTLLRVLMGLEEPVRGSLTWGTGVEPEHFPQDLSGLDDEKTVLQEMYSRHPDLGLGGAREYLAGFGFYGEDVFNPVGTLSGGERTRLLLAGIALGDASLLFLDEPTNHLDLDARADLERALTSYGGTVVFVTHDRYFLDRVARKLWVLIGGELETFEGNYSEYLEHSQARQDEGGPDPEPTDRGKGSQEPGPAPSPRPQVEVGELEERITALEERVDELNELLTDPDSYAQGRGRELALEYRQVQKELRTLYRQWEEAAEVMEEQRGES